MRLNRPRSILYFLPFLTSCTRASFQQQQPILRNEAFSTNIFASANMTTRGPVIAFSHGGGPLPLLGDPKHEAIVRSLKERVPKLLRLGTPEVPRAIVLVTAHWSEKVPTISNGSKHKLYYDYYGFPPETYHLKYDAQGAPDVAKEVAEAMKVEGLKPEFDEHRGWDHGVFIPMLLVNPKADIPIVQVSVLDSESPEDHYKMGKALGKLRDSNVAIIGSGFATFHNMRLWFSGVTRQPAFRKKNDAWSVAVTNGMEEPDTAARLSKIQNWRDWPNSYEMHPRGAAEHFLPLLVCAGAAGDAPAKSYTDVYDGLDMYSYYWD